MKLTRRQSIALSAATIFSVSNVNLNHKHDWVEPLRRKLYPKLHHGLEKVGGYGVGTVGEGQYVTTLPSGEEHLEEVLSERGWTRNVIACYKVHKDGRESEGSWRLRGSKDTFGLLNDEDKQLHITLFNNSENEGHIDVYCHQEYDWMKAPMKHLREVELEYDEGSRKAARFIRDHTYLKWYDKNE